MAKLAERPYVSLTATLELTEDEIRALDALTRYSTDSILLALSKGVGESFVNQHKDGLTSLLAGIGESTHSLVKKADDAKRVFSGEWVAVTKDYYVRSQSIVLGKK